MRTRAVREGRSAVGRHCGSRRQETGLWRLGDKLRAASWSAPLLRRIRRQAGSGRSMARPSSFGSARASRLVALASSRRQPLRSCLSALNGTDPTPGLSNAKRELVGLRPCIRHRPAPTPLNPHGCAERFSRTGLPGFGSGPELTPPRPQRPGWVGRALRCAPSVLVIRRRAAEGPCPDELVMAST
jgi:hypothetical protein